MTAGKVAYFAAFTLCAASPAIAEENATNGAIIFKRCAMCHSVDPAKPSGVGPNLAGVVGRKAGLLPRYLYSKSMGASGITWTTFSLDKFLARPQGLVPGTKMAFSGLSNPKERQDLIGYLSSHKK